MKANAKAHTTKAKGDYRIAIPKSRTFCCLPATSRSTKDAVKSGGVSIIPFLNHAQFKVAVYDRVSYVLTDYEEGEAGAEDLYELLCFMQCHWDDITGEYH